MRVSRQDSLFNIFGVVSGTRCCWVGFFEWYDDIIVVKDNAIHTDLHGRPGTWFHVASVFLN